MIKTRGSVHVLKQGRLLTKYPSLSPSLQPSFPSTQFSSLSEPQVIPALIAEVESAANAEREAATLLQLEDPAAAAAAAASGPSPSSLASVSAALQRALLGLLRLKGLPADWQTRIKEALVRWGLHIFYSLYAGIRKDLLNFLWQSTHTHTNTNTHMQLIMPSCGIDAAYCCFMLSTQINEYCG